MKHSVIISSKQVTFTSLSSQANLIEFLLLNLFNSYLFFLIRSLLFWFSLIYPNLHLSLTFIAPW